MSGVVFKETLRRKLTRSASESDRAEPDGYERSPSLALRVSFRGICPFSTMGHQTPYYVFLRTDEESGKLLSIICVV